MDNTVYNVYKDLVALFGEDSIEEMTDPEDKKGRTLFIIEREIISAIGDKKIQLFKNIINQAQMVFMIVDDNKVRFTIAV